MTEQRSEIDSLFQRMTARSTPVETPVPVVPAPAAMATPVAATASADEWPLFTMLRQPRRTWRPPHMMMAVDEPMALVAPATVAGPTPTAEPTSVVSSLGADDEQTRRLSPLEMLFARAEQSGQAQKAGSVFEPVSETVAAPPANLPHANLSPPPRMAPPPLKTRATPLPPIAPRNAASAAPDAQTTIAPRNRDWQPLDNVPSHLFDRVGAR